MNGEKVDAAGKTFESYLSQAGFDTKRIAVIRNDDIVPKCEYSTCTIDEDDVIEVVSFVGGG
ncbi:MAG: sulfur carrier protein ThiS [Clostridiales bacterium]|nr:sulfur carrier protein ThiS [Clostridiales bacterium]